MNLNSQLYWRRLFREEHDRHVFSPNLESMFRATGYRIEESLDGTEQWFVVIEPEFEFDFVAGEFQPFLDRVFAVLELWHIKVIQGDRVWEYEAGFDEANNFGWWLTEGDRVEDVRNSFFDYVMRGL